MARKKLERFRENSTMPHVLEPSREEVMKGLAWKGRWKSDFFKNEKPLVLELGCGKGEYTVAMAQKFPDKNFIGIDIKGARIWYGAKDVEKHELDNAAFLRTQIELLEYCFDENEVDEIWITFPDPQIKYKRMKHRMTNPEFLNMYNILLNPKGIMHLKTDSEFLHGYTHGILQAFDFNVLEAYHDIDLQLKDRDHLLHSVRTHYEGLFRDKGKTVTYIKFQPHG